jgi:hypothetical protein
MARAPAIFGQGDVTRAARERVRAAVVKAASDFINEIDAKLAKLGVDVPSGDGDSAS